MQRERGLVELGVVMEVPGFAKAGTRVEEGMLFVGELTSVERMATKACTFCKHIQIVR